jgi:methyltransferase (TIGR00027 family)
MNERQELGSNEKSIEHTPSETAMGAVTLRALAAIEGRGRDYLAEIFLAEDRKSAFRDPIIRESIIKKGLIPGMYEFIVARTIFFDLIVEQALRENIPQIIFMGAGYDSRPYRFRELIKDTRIFELDSPLTQKHKKDMLHQGKIPIPNQLVFLPVNFNRDNLGDVLTNAGFIRGHKSLFVWEGVTYYLQAKVIDDTLNILKTISSAGSSICFDYASLSPASLKDHGMIKLRELMKSRYPGEPTFFGIQEGTIGSFLLE